MLRMRIGYSRRISRSFAVCDENLVSHGITKHSHTMPALLLGERLSFLYVWTVKEVHLTPLLRLQRFFLSLRFGLNTNQFVFVRIHL